MPPLDAAMRSFAFVFLMAAWWLFCFRKPDYATLALIVALILWRGWYRPAPRPLPGEET